MKFNPFSVNKHTQSANNEEVKETSSSDVIVKTSDIESMRNIINIAAKMRALLERCRYENLPMNLAKQIDELLRESEQFD